jgi:hypothetical protein
MNSPEIPQDPAAVSEDRTRTQETRDSAPQTKSLSDWYLPPWLRLLAVMAGFAVLAGIVIVPSLGTVREGCRRSLPSANLRQIGQGALIYAADHNDELPFATDVWDYAEKLARLGLNDASVWGTGSDPANADELADMITVLTPDGKHINSEFRKLKPSWAVAVVKLTAASPASTPIAWTRGLRTDGTWSPHSPYGTDGGHIVFLGGSVQWFRNLTHQLVSRDGTLTSNILDALPPGARISEYVPTEAEQREWAAVKLRRERIQVVKDAVLPIVIPAIWLIALVVLIVKTARGKCTWWAIVGFLLATLGLLAVLIPFVGKVRE